VPRITFDPEWLHFVAQCPIDVNELLGIDAKVKVSKLAAFDFAKTIERLVTCYVPVGTVYFVRNDVDYAEKQTGDTASAILRRRPSAVGQFVMDHHSCKDGYVRAIQALVRPCRP
jgi:hypothetical protein